MRKTVVGPHETPHWSKVMQKIGEENTKESILFGRTKFHLDQIYKWAQLIFAKAYGSPSHSCQSDQLDFRRHIRYYRYITKSIIHLHQLNCVL